MTQRASIILQRGETLADHLPGVPLIECQDWHHGGPVLVDGQPTGHRASVFRGRPERAIRDLILGLRQALGQPLPPVVAVGLGDRVQVYRVTEVEGGRALRGAAVGGPRRAGRVGRKTAEIATDSPWRTR